MSARRKRRNRSKNRVSISTPSASPTASNHPNRTSTPSPDAVQSVTQKSASGDSFKQHNVERSGAPIGRIDENRRDATAIASASLEGVAELAAGSFASDATGLATPKRPALGEGAGAEEKLSSRTPRKPNNHINNNDASVASSHGGGRSLSSFFWFLTQELSLYHAADEDDSSSQQRRVYNFVTLPMYLEALLGFGFLVCLDCFAFLFTFLPLRMFSAALTIVWSALRGRWSLSKRQRADLMQGMILIVCFCVLNMFGMSKMYHYIRGQSVLKLYVIFNMLQIVDKLCCSIGEDILDSLFGCRNQHPVITLLHFGVACGYVFVHAYVLFIQMITLNVSVNSSSNSLLVLLVSNNFVELKSTVFKRFRPQNLFQVSCSDIVERFQLSLFIVVIIIQNVSHLGMTATSTEWLYSAAWVVLALFGSEVVVDAIKHGFMSKFNYIDPPIYLKFCTILSSDYVAAHSRRHSFTHTHAVSRRLGFSALPLGCMVLRVLYKTVSTMSIAWHMKAAIAVMLWLVLTSIKILLSIVLLGISTTFLARESDGAVDVKPKVSADLVATDRYSLIGSRVPM